MRVNVSFNDSPTLHDIMRAAGYGIITIVRVKVHEDELLPNNEQIFHILDIHDLEVEYYKFVHIYYDMGDNVEQFRRRVLDNLRTNPS